MSPTNFRPLIVSLAVLIWVTSCSQDRSLPHDPLASSRPAETQSDDPALVMRDALRSMSDSAFAELARESGDAVVVGFRQIGSIRGVSRYGESLVPAGEVSDRLAAVLQQFADSIIYPFKWIPAVAVRLVSTEAALELRKLPWVDYVAPSSDLVTPDVQSQCSPLSSPQVTPWNITRIRAHEVWPVAEGDSAPKKLVLLDDGADEGDDWYAQELFWEVYSFYVPSTAENGDHGTAVLGAAQARDNNVGTVGAAPLAVARVMKIFDPQEDTRWEMHSATAVDDNATLATVMTISYSSKLTTEDPPGTMAGLYDAISNAYYQHGVLFTASTGNQSSPNIYSYPARFDEVIGVGGSGHDDEYVLNNYAEGNVELAAPAVDVLTVCKGGDIGEADGTSFATPLVAGSIMLVREELPSISNDSLRTLLRNTAMPMADPQQSGAGRIDVAYALGFEPPEPPEPLTVEVSGPTTVPDDTYCTYIANASGGTEPYSYAWFRNGVPIGDDSPYVQVYTGDLDSYTVRVDVTDAESEFASNDLDAVVSAQAQPCFS